MDKEALYVSKEQLFDVIKVIKNGLCTTTSIDPLTREMLEAWCDEENEYLYSDDFSKAMERIDRKVNND